jgi:hypothetical protein
MYVLYVKFDYFAEGNHNFNFAQYKGNTQLWGNNLAEDGYN